MSNEERFKKYVEENCKNCENKNKFLCNIRIIKRTDGIVETKCNYYKRENKTEGCKDEIKMTVTARKQKPIMKGINR